MTVFLLGLFIIFASITHVWTGVTLPIRKLGCCLCRSKDVRSPQGYFSHDGYRSHMTMKIFETLRNGNIFTYCLPSHTSGNTQLLDVRPNSDFKSEFNAEIRKATYLHDDPSFDNFDLLLMIKRAYIKSFLETKIISSFYLSCLWLSKHVVLFGTAYPENNNLIYIV